MPSLVVQCLVMISICSPLSHICGFSEQNVTSQLIGVTSVDITSLSYLFCIEFAFTAENVFSKTYIFKIGSLRCKFSAIRRLNPIVLSYVGFEQCLFPPVVEVLGRTVRCEQEYPVSGCFLNTPNLACTNMRYVSYFRIYVIENIFALSENH